MSVSSANNQIPHATEVAMRFGLLRIAAQEAPVSFAALEQIIGPDHSRRALQIAQAQDQVSLHILRVRGVISPDHQWSLCSPQRPNQTSAVNQVKIAGYLTDPLIAELFAREQKFACPSCRLVFPTLGSLFPPFLNCPACQTPDGAHPITGAAGAMASTVGSPNIEPMDDANAATIAPSLSSEHPMSHIYQRHLLLSSSAPELPPGQSLSAPPVDEFAEAQTIYGDSSALASASRQLPGVAHAAADESQTIYGDSSALASASRQLPGVMPGAGLASSSGSHIPGSTDGATILTDSAKFAASSLQGSNLLIQPSINPHVGIPGSASALVDSARGQTGALRRSTLQNSMSFSGEFSAEGFLGDSIGPWTLVKVLGQGGMGAVYQGRNENGQLSAIKLVIPKGEKGLAYLPRFRQEAEVTSKLDHPNIIRAFSYGEDPVPHLILEYFEGQDLGQILKKHRRLPMAEALTVTKAILEALDHAHSKGIIHRDIKPDNIMVAENGRYCLTDFGLGRMNKGDEAPRLTLTGRLMGTLHYLAPEQADNPKAAGSKADIYSMGALLFRILTGQPPFTGSQVEILAAICGSPTPEIRAWNPDLPLELEKLLLKVMAKDPEDRLPDARAFITEIEKIEGSQAGQESEVSAGEKIGLAAGDELNGWELGKVLGVGGMGKVFQAEKDDIRAALKVLTSAIADDPTMLERFKREIDVTSKLQHPNIIRVHDSGVARFNGKDYPFMAMELLDGDIADLLDKNGPMDAEQAVKVALGAGRALAFAHKNGVIHRDVKPENLLLHGSKVQEARIRVTDFGVAALSHTDTKLTQSTAALGSPHYMAPEQARSSKNIDGRADLYALGATLYHLLTGRRLFSAETIQGLLLAHDQRLPQRADTVIRAIPEELAWIVDYAVLKQAKHRPADMEEWLRDLQSWLDKSLDKARLKVIKSKVSIGRRPYEKQSSSIPMLVMITLLLLVSSAALWLYFNQEVLDPYATERKLIAQVESQALEMKADKSPQVLSETLANLRLLARAKLPEELAKKREGLSEKVDNEALELVKRLFDGIVQQPFNPQKETRTSIAEVSSALVKRLDQRPWKNRMQGSLDKINQGLSFIDSAVLLDQEREKLRALEQSKDYEQLLGVKSVGVLGQFIKKVERLKAIESYQKDAISTLLKTPKEIEARCQKAYNALKLKRQRLEKELEAARSSDQFKKATGAISQFINEIPGANKHLLEQTTKLLKRENPEKIAAREAFDGLNKKLANAQIIKQYHQCLADLRAFRERFGKYPEAAKALDWIRKIEGLRDKELARLFKDLEAKQARSMNAKKLLRQADFVAAITAVEQAASEKRFSGVAKLSKLKSDRVRVLEKRRDQYAVDLLSKISRLFHSRPGKPSAVSFGKQMRDTLKWLAIYSEFPTARESEAKWMKAQIAYLLDLHSDDKMSFIKAHSQQLGADEEGFTHHPPQTVKTAAYHIDRYEVSVAQYKYFLDFQEQIKKGSSQSLLPQKWKAQRGQIDWPVRGVTLIQARSYSLWAGKRLPTEDEWELAARGGEQKNAGPYAWGGSPPTKSLARFGLNEDNAGPVKVKSLGSGAAPGGLYHMSGNVAEWTESLFKPYPGGDVSIFRQFPGFPRAYVTRGGSYKSDEGDLQIWVRTCQIKSAADLNVGFRCVVSK
jgi:eukaryotic-like serine/threonine-protein kinase